MQPGYARYVLGVMVGINFLNYLDRYILPVVASKIQDEFHLSDAAIGGLGTAFLLVYAVAALPFGIWADRGVRRTVVGVGVAIWSLATLFTGLARSYVQLFAARAVLGIGEASYYPAGTSLLGDYFGKAQRGRAMSIWGAGTAVGIAVGFAGGGIVASILGWRAAFYLTAIPGLVFAVLAFRLREPLRGAAEARGPKPGPATRVTVQRFLRPARHSEPAGNYRRGNAPLLCPWRGRLLASGIPPPALRARDRRRRHARRWGPRPWRADRHAQRRRPG